MIESESVDAIEYDAIELARLEVSLQMCARIDDVFSSSKALLAGIDFQRGKVLRLEEVWVVKRVPRAAYKQNTLVLRVPNQFRKDDIFQDHAVSAFFPRVESVGDQPTMKVNPEMLERIQRLALRFR